MTNNSKLALTIGTMMIVTAVAIALIAYSFFPTLLKAGKFPQQSLVPKGHASTTVTTLTTGVSTLLVSTSTRKDANGLLPATAGRLALTFQLVNCVAPNADAWLNFNDVAAATSTSYWLTSSTTVTFADDLPLVHGSVRVWSGEHNCSIAVTEWRSEN